MKLRTPKYKEANYITGISARQKATPTYPGRSIKTIDARQSEGQPGLIARNGQVGDWLTGVSCQDPAAIKSATERSVCIAWVRLIDVTRHVVLAYI